MDGNIRGVSFFSFYAGDASVIFKGFMVKC